MITLGYKLKIKVNYIMKLSNKTCDISEGRNHIDFVHYRYLISLEC